MDNVTFSEPTDADMGYLADNLRASDVTEFRCLFPTGDLKHPLVWSALNSDEVLVAKRGGIPVAVFGVGHTELGGVPWMGGTDGINQLKLTTLRTVKVVIDAWLNHYGYLYNDVHRDNHKSQAMLRWLGFTIEADSDFHPEFQRFWKRKEG